MCWMAKSTVMYVREQSFFGIPSLMFRPAGWDKSIIKRHLSGWWYFGITPNLLICASGMVDPCNGPATWCCMISSARYWVAVFGCRRAHSRLRFADLRGLGNFVKLMWKPWEIPLMKNHTSSWLGWLDSSDAQFLEISGVVILVASFGTLTVTAKSERWAVQAGTHSWYRLHVSSMCIPTTCFLDNAAKERRGKRGLCFVESLAPLNFWLTISFHTYLHHNKAGVHHLEIILKIFLLYQSTYCIYRCSVWRMQESP